MPKTKECPKCGKDISHSYSSAEPDVGIFGSGWYCATCDETVEDLDDDLDHFVDLRRDN